MGEHRTDERDTAEGGLLARERPAHLADSKPPPRRRRRWRRAVLVVLGVPVLVVLLGTIWWTIDTSAGRVPRNVSLAGVDVSRMSESKLATRVAALAEDHRSTPVEIVSEGRTYTTDAAAVGLRVDEGPTVEAALDVDDGTAAPLKPFAWMRSFFAEREVDLRFKINVDQAQSTITALEGEHRTAPTEPSFELVEGALAVVPGEDGHGIDADDLSERLAEAAAEARPGEPIRVEVPQVTIEPTISDEEAEAALADAEALVAEPIVVETPAGSRTIEPDAMRGWPRLELDADGMAQVTLAPDAVDATLRRAFADIEGAPKPARITLSGDGRPVVIADEPGLVCCSPESPGLLLEALRNRAGTVALQLHEGRADFTTEAAEAYRIVEPVGGARAWRSGADIPGPKPGFTTYHAAGGNRVANIHRIADLVRGAVIPPGGSFSINEHVGRRTAEKGFLPAGAIRDGQHVDEIGGGISQFATTMFNAAYFAGLDIPEYQAHSEWFDRYPRGREATMGYPAPDLRIQNNTPYGVLIWTSYTDTSLTVTLYSTTHATAEQTGISEASAGRCRVVTTTRTRTFPDGHTEQDTFRARYRPGEGQSC